MEELEIAIINIIINAGDCKNNVYMALSNVDEGKYKEADKEMHLADNAIAKVHDWQTMFLFLYYE